ncbi:non-homologous end-joining DNA ligase [Desulfohalovibrio reitneri]|uniref:non-homologous end-joining DNA ligase n=1 Tax=Desulfohalovibrio reitneri TaxID=1307759 RepID=UPI0004A71A78|nr:non-homologous end-joining DNA ligase [Desulfohalovibrio reitneri]
MSKRTYGPYSFEASREDKVLYPDDGITKGMIMDYYEAVAEDLLRHAGGRPLTLRRFPDGIDAFGFYQQDAPDHFPDWMERVTVDKEGGHVDHVVARRAADLAFLADQGTLVLHMWGSRADDVRLADRLVFDMDPPEGGEFGVVRRAAADLREMLREMGLTGFPMTTGSKGMHVVAPLRPREDFDEVREVARRAAERLAARKPDEYTTEQRKKKRGGRLFLDWLRNSYGHTTVAPYSLRAKPGAPVAAPLTWEEVAAPDVGPRSFSLRDVPDRLSRHGDPWKGMYRRAASLDGARRRLAAKD